MISSCKCSSMICSRSSRPRPRPWRARRHRRPSTIASMTRRRRTGARPRRRRASGTGLPAAIDPKGVPTHLSTLSIRLIFAGRLRTHRDIASPCRGRVVLLVPALLLLSAATHRSDPPPPCLDPLCFPVPLPRDRSSAPGVPVQRGGVDEGAGGRDDAGMPLRHGRRGNGSTGSTC